MKVVYAFYAAHRYWPDEQQLKADYEAAASSFCHTDEYVVCWDDRTEALTAQGDCLVIIPFSGAIQKLILTDACSFPNVILCGAYIRGNLPQSVSEAMLRANAAPAFMDTWAVLRRTCQTAFYALNQADLKKKLRLVEAAEHVKHAKILKIGATEPWVVSNASSSAVYEKRLGLQIIPVDHSEVIQRYENTSPDEALPFYTWFKTNSRQIAEPDEAALWSASRMTSALVKLLEEYDADGAAIACFHLLKTGTTMCTGVSYINDCTDKVISCEGDMDSAVTMLLMKKLTDYKLWMANPGLQPDGTIHFSHCTAPVCIMGKPLPTVLRSHHESGIGVSLQVDIPSNLPVTACRISDDCRRMTIHKGTTISGNYETACRTQVHIRLDDFEHYMNTALGCHQVLAFEDISDDLKELARLFSIEVL